MECISRQAAMDLLELTLKAMAASEDAINENLAKECPKEEEPESNPV